MSGAPAWADAGNWADRAAQELRVTASPTDPSAASPTAVPTWRAEFSTPDASPLCSSGSADTATAEIVGTAIP